MKFLVDANVLSEATEPAPDERCIAWLRTYERDLVVDPVILGEIRFGILLLSKGKRRARLEQWFATGVERLQCLPWDAETGLRWAELLAALRRSGRAMPIKDRLIAATALVHGLTIATRNHVDFQPAWCVRHRSLSADGVAAHRSLAPVEAASRYRGGCQFERLPQHTRPNRLPQCCRIESDGHAPFDDASQLDGDTATACGDGHGHADISGSQRSLRTAIAESINPEEPTAGRMFVDTRQARRRR